MYPPLIRKLFFAAALILAVSVVKAGDTLHAPVRIAVLLPLNLDSAFNGTEYNLSNSKISQYFLSGLDFYSGVMMAIDSLQKEHANVEVWIYDTHKANQTIQQLTKQIQPLNFSFIIASITNAAEQKTLSDFSAANSIPVISATFPNDIYLENNPFFIMVNPVWKTHVDAIYNYLSQNYRGKTVTLFTRKGTLESRISDELYKMNASRLIRLSTVILNDNFSAGDVLTHLDSTTQNIVVCGSLYESFGQALIKVLNDNGTTYSSVVIGMPTWSGMNGITGTSADKIQIVITTPYNYTSGGQFVSVVSDNYKSLYYTRPSDMVYKGYETMYHFTKLLLSNPDNFINKLSDSSYKFSNDYEFIPVRLSHTSFVPDYLENKKIYFLKVISGRITMN
jgi:ABC-type branched-subunit amino acid transport system substrate-binding protein